MPLRQVFGGRVLAALSRLAVLNRFYPSLESCVCAMSECGLSDMIKIKTARIKPLLHWSVFSRIGLALSLSLFIWALVLNVTYSS